MNQLSGPIPSELGDVATLYTVILGHNKLSGPQTERYGLGLLRPRERRQPRMPNATSPLVEQGVVAFALGHPGFGPARIAAELARPQWGGIRLSHNRVWRILKRHALNTRHKRLGLVAGYAAPPEPTRPEPQPERHLEVSRPGELVQFDCFHVGRLSGTRGAVWQYTAIDVASAFTWAELLVTPRNPAAKWTSRLARRVAADLAARGWEFETVMSDNGSEFVHAEFGETRSPPSAPVQRFIHAGRPQTNGCVERVQGTILEECRKPSFARHLIPKQNGLRRDLLRHLDYYNTDAPTPAAGRAGAPLKASSARPGYGRDAQPDVSADPGGRTGEARKTSCTDGSSVELGTVVQEPLRRARLARRAQLGALRVDQDQVGVGHLLAQAQAQLLRLADREAVAVRPSRPRLPVRPKGTAASADR